MKSWYYYLHTNGDLIGKSPAVVDSDSSYFDGPFVKKVWRIDLEDRFDAWKLILEALVLGAELGRIQELIAKWNLTFQDSVRMIKRSEGKVTDKMKKGLTIYIEKFLNISIDEYWDKVKVKWNDN